jgi:tRNA(Ile)-lysidine synthase
MADAFVRDFCRIAADVRVEFDRDLMSTLDRTMARRTVRAAVFRAFPDASRLEAAHVERIVDALADGGARFDLPGGLEVTGEYATLVVSHGGQEPPRVAPCLLPVPGSVDLGPGGVMHARLVDPSDASGTDDSVVIDADLLADELVVDSAREGDRMQPLGMAGRRKLSDMLVDAKVPRRLRGAVPVVRDDEDIVWLAGVRMSDAYRVRESTRRAVRLSWDPREDSWDEADGRTGE